MNYTVILKHWNYGEWVRWIHADKVKDAIRLASQELSLELDEDIVDDVEVIAVFAGNLEDLKP